MKKQSSETLPPLPSRATRTIARRSKASSRGAVVVQLPCDSRPRIIEFESKLEQRVLWLLLARPDVWDIREQPASLGYVDEAGKSRRHTFDFLVTLQSGRRYAVVVKPERHACKSRFLRGLADLRRAMHKGYADEILLITDRSFTRAEALNAQRLHDFRRHRDMALTARLQDLIDQIVFPITVGELARALDAGGAAFRTVFMGIYDGLLGADTSRIIDERTILSRRVRS